ncbi:hypothetical protein L6452_20982 [Arctium lappa]|uniref:Uncharacterized protein n=1 Tax=Arctium lappa TaxID=4217 RepID=A0ACB9BDE5_ARCLA|nr:hypothetical protein L6452_20982 [Arctium lappa]
MHSTKYAHVCSKSVFTEIKFIEKMKNYNNFPYSSFVGDDLWSSLIDQSGRRIYEDYATTIHQILPPDDLANQFSLTPNTTPPWITSAIIRLT